MKRVARKPSKNKPKSTTQPSPKRIESVQNAFESQYSQDKRFYNPTLAIMIDAAVTLRILTMEKYRVQHGELPERIYPDAADIVAAKGDILQFGGGKPGEVARVFNALAEGVAFLAFCPGGVRLFGNHYIGGPNNAKSSR